MSLSRRFLLPAFAVLAGLLPIAPAAYAAQGPFGTAMLRELNRVRAHFHLPPVSDDSHMNDAAASHSRDMARHRYFAHGAWTGRVARAAGGAHSLGEVLGWLSHASPASEASSMVRNWLNSPEHRRVLLDGQFRRVGIGRATGGWSAIYTVDFASAR
jgi:uncharacterized protein YkwD